MARNPRKNIKQPELPISPLNPYHGQDFPTLQRNESGLTLDDLLGLGNNWDGHGPHQGGGPSYPQPEQQNTNGQNPHNANYSEMLNHNASDSFSQFLASLGITQYGGLDATQRNAWNNYLLQTQVQQYLEQNSRDYNRALQLDQRIYDSPTNQLARLMGAGISRDAAIQLLSGAAGGGSAAPIAGAAAGPGDMAAANEAGQMPLRNVMSVFGTIANIAGAIGSLGSFGLSAASLSTNLAATKAATAGQLLSNTQLQKTLNGIETASTVVGAISSAYQAGIIDKDQTFDSSQDMLKYIRDNADKFEPFNSLVSSGALDGISKDVYSLDALNHAYSSWRKTKDYNIDRKHIVAMQALDEMFQDINIKSVQQEIEQSKQWINESIANVINSTKLANADVALKFAQTDLANYQSDLAYIQREMSQQELDWLTANIDDINAVRTNQIMLDAAKWNALRYDPQAYNAEIESWLSDRQNLRSAIAIESYYYSNRLNAINDMQQQSIPFSDINFAQMVCWFHNLFSNTALPRPGSATQHERDMLGSLEGSQVALWALRKAYHMP